MKETNLQKYGSEYYQDSEIGRKQFRHTMEEKDLWVPYEQLKDFDKYRREVEKYTSKNRKRLKGIENRGRYKFHVDHKYSVYEGFKNNIVPWIIGSLSNLEMIYCSDNLRKNTKCSITLEELMEKYKKE